ncbi:MAG: carboxypeptidase regulatory-like domain-containing protein [bacterium]
MEFKKIFSSVLTLCFLMSVSLSNAATLTVTVLDEAGAGVSGAKVVVNKHSDGSMVTPFPTTNASGVAEITLTDNEHYGFNANKDGYMPSWYDGAYMDSDQSRTLTIYEPPPGTAQVDVLVTHGDTTSETVITFVNVKNRQTGEYISYGSGADTDMAGAGDYGVGVDRISVYAIPIDADNKYDIDVWCQTTGKGSTISDYVNESTENFSIDLTGDFNYMPTNQTGSGEELGDVVVKGRIVNSADSQPLSNVDVSMWGSNSNFVARSDDNGIFMFYNNLDGDLFATNTYYFNFMRNEFRGQQWEFYYDYVVGNSTETVITMTPATGKIKGVVYMDEILVPNAWVSVWSDNQNGVWESGDDWEKPGMGFGNARTSGGAFTMEGIASGRYTLQVWSEFNNQPGEFNRGADLESTTDDLIIQVDETGATTNDSGGDNGIYATVLNVSNEAVAAAAYYADVDSDGIKEIIVNMISSANGENTITGTVSFLDNTPPELDDVMIIARADCSSDSSQGPPNAKFTTLGASAQTVTGEYPFTISNVPDDTYRIRVIAPNFGMKFDDGNRDNENITLAGGATKTIAFTMAPAGSVNVKLMKPDGSIFRRVQGQYGNDGASANVNADSWGSGSWGWGEVDDGGNCLISGLLPGKYSLRTNGWGSAYEYATARKNDVIVTAGATTNVTIPLKEGSLINPVLSETLPQEILDMLAQDDGGGEEGGDRAHMQLVYTPADVIINLKNFEEYFGDHEGAPSIYWWNGAFETIRLEPGRYNFYMHLGAEQESTSHFYRTIIGKALDVEVAADKMINDYYPHWAREGDPAWKVQNITVDVSIGAGTLSGNYVGVNTIREADQKIIEKNFDNFMDFVPKVILQKGTDFLGWAMCVPNPERMADLDKVPDSEIGSKIGTDFGSLVYGVHYLTEQDGVKALVTTPNYPANYKTVNITGTWDIDMDKDVGAGATLVGYVRSGETAIADATVNIKGRLLDRSVITEADGSYLIPGLAPGVYRMLVTAEGYALDAEKVAIHAQKNTIVNFNLTACTGSISGTVFARKFPFPLTSAGDKVVAFDDTANGENPEKELALYETITESDGSYTIKPCIAGHTYKVYLVVPGKAVVPYNPSPLIPADESAVTGKDFVYENKQMELGLIAYPNSNGTVSVEGKSPGELTEKSATYNEGSEYGAGTVYSVDESTVKEIGDNRWLFPLPVDNTRFYTIRFTLGKGAQTHTIDFVYDPNKLSAKEEDIDDDAVTNGEFLLNPDGGDPSGLYFSAGSITLDPDSDAPQCSMEREDNASSTEAGYMPLDQQGGDVYRVDLTMNGSEQNDSKTMTLTIGYDPDLIGENPVGIVQWDEASQSWIRVVGNVMVDPMSNTCSIEVDSIENAALSSQGLAPKKISRASFNGKEYVLSKRASSTSNQAGIFMAVKSDQGAAYTGSDLWVFNVPNPFNLKEKDVRTDKGSSAQISGVKGTLIRFAVPPGLGDDIDARFRIYNIAGELVRELKAKDIITGGVDAGYYYYIEWDGKNGDGKDCASGVYFCYAEVGHKKKVIKMALIK